MRFQEAILISAKALAIAAILHLTSCGSAGSSNGHGSNDSLAPKADSITYRGDTADGLIRIRTADGKYGFQDLSGKTTIAPQFQLAFDFFEGVAKVKQEGKFGYIDKQGKLLIPCSYDKLQNNSQGRVGFLKEGKWGFLTLQNQVLIPPTFDSVKVFGQGFASVQVGEDWGYIDSTGKVVIAPQYMSAWPFREDLAHCLNKQGYWGYINQKGKTVIPFKFLNCGEFIDGRAYAQTESHWLVIDKSGKCVDHCEPPQDNLDSVKFDLTEEQIRQMQNEHDHDHGHEH